MPGGRELAKAANVSLDTPTTWSCRRSALVEHGTISASVRLPGELLDAWVSRTPGRALDQTSSPPTAYAVSKRWPGGPRRLVRCLHAALGRGAGGASSRMPAVHCYLEGSPEPLVRALARPGAADGNVHLMTLRRGVFYALITKYTYRWCACRSSTPISITTAAGPHSEPPETRAMGCLRRADQRRHVVLGRRRHSTRTPVRSRPRLLGPLSGSLLARHSQLRARGDARH
jgi:hypothetical protein